MKRSRFLPAVLVLFACGPADLRAGTPPTPESARPYGMGGAFSAVADDANAMIYNPAGLAGVRRVEAQGSLSRASVRGAGPLTEAFASGTYPLSFYRETWKFGTAGAMLHTTSRSGEDTISNLSASLGAAPSDLLPKKWLSFSVPESFWSGATLRIRRNDRAGSSGADLGLGMDLGFLYRFPDHPDFWRNGWSLGLVFQEMNAGPIGGPPRTRLAGAWRYKNSVLAMDMLSEGGTTRFFPGIESVLYRNLVVVRAGSADLSGRPKQLTLGAGIQLPPLQLDFAYGFPLGKLSDTNERFLASITYRFGAPSLTQFLSGTESGEKPKIENTLSAMEFRRASLKAGIKEDEDRHEKIKRDLADLRARAAQAKLDAKKGEEDLSERRREIEELWKEIQKLQAEKKQLLTAPGAEASAAAPLRPGDAPRRHKVRKGETLRGLSEKYYGDPGLWKVIYDANLDKILRGTPKADEVLDIP